MVLLFLTVSGSRTVCHTVRHLLPDQSCLQLPGNMPNSQKASGRGCLPLSGNPCRFKIAPGVLSLGRAYTPTPETPRRTVSESRPPTPSKFHPSPKETPRRGPPGRLHLQYSKRKSGACAGEGLGGGGPRGTGHSLRGGFLQGLLQRWESYQTGPSKVFFLWCCSCI